MDHLNSVDNLVSLLDSAAFFGKCMYSLCTYLFLFSHCSVGEIAVGTKMLSLLGPFSSERLADHDEELGVVDAAVAVRVGLLDHGLQFKIVKTFLFIFRGISGGHLHFVLRQRLAHICHHVLQLPRRDQTVAVLVENPAILRTVFHLIHPFEFELLT